MPKENTKKGLPQGLTGSELASGIDGLGPQLLLDAENLVEFGKTLRPGGGTSLDLSSSQTNNDVGNGDILSLSGTVRDHDTPASGVGVFGGLNGLGEGTDLVNLEKEGVAALLGDGSLYANGIGDRQVITTTQVSNSNQIPIAANLPDNLEVRGPVEVAPCFPVILSKWILDGDNRVFSR